MWSRVLRSRLPTAPVRGARRALLLPLRAPLLVTAGGARSGVPLRSCGAASQHWFATASTQAEEEEAPAAKDAWTLAREEELSWPENYELRAMTEDEAYVEQTELETEVYRKAIEKYKDTIKQVLQGTDKPVKDQDNPQAIHSLLLRWYEPLSASIHTEQTNITDGTSGRDRKVYGPYLLELSPEELAVIVLHEFVNMVLVETDGVRVVRAATRVGRAVEAAVLMKRLKDATRDKDKRDKQLREELENKKKAPEKWWNNEVDDHDTTTNKNKMRLWKQETDGRYVSSAADGEPFKPTVVSRADFNAWAEKSKDLHYSTEGGKVDHPRRLVQHYKGGKDWFELKMLRRNRDKSSLDFGQLASDDQPEGYADVQMLLKKNGAVMGGDNDGEEEEDEQPVRRKGPSAYNTEYKYLLDKVQDGKHGHGRIAKEARTRLEKISLEEQETAAAAQKEAVAASTSTKSALEMHARLRERKSEPEWDLRTAVKVGAALLAKVLQTAKITYRPPPVKDADGVEKPTSAQEVFAFKHVYTSDKSRRYGTLKAHDHVFTLVVSGGSGTENDSIADKADAKFMPMVIQPRPWKGVDQGGYLHLPTKVMRTRGEREQLEALRAAGDMPELFEGLNALGKVPWQINRKIFDVATFLYDQGGDVAGLPSVKDLNIPKKPAKFEDVKMTDLEEDEKAELSAFVRMQARINQTNRELHSMRCDTKLKLEVASRMKEFESIYFPYNIDFRGRSYPIPPNLNHLGSDMCRGLLQFSEEKPLGEGGLHWLKVHLANLVGNDKISFQDRAAWIDDQMDHVRDSATFPISGSRWWTGADSPFQALATCTDLINALDSPDPTKYMSRLPVHMDGSCNGLQHYAALGRDERGGMEVNLLPTDKPQDVYTGVANLVIAKIEEDKTYSKWDEMTEKERNKVNNMRDEELKEMELARIERQSAQVRKFAHMLDGHITRKVVKQTVMTSVYGVTFVGARKQIQARLEERLITPNTPTTEEAEKEMYALANYVARTTLDQMNLLFKGAREIMVRTAYACQPQCTRMLLTFAIVFLLQAWLGDCADRVSKAPKDGGGNQCMAWITPFGMPIIQVRAKLSKPAALPNTHSPPLTNHTVRIPSPIVQHRPRRCARFCSTSCLQRTATSRR
jgi:DNA-directed RNA polymerase